MRLCSPCPLYPCASSQVDEEIEVPPDAETRPPSDSRRGADAKPSTLTAHRTETRRGNNHSTDVQDKTSAQPSQPASQPRVKAKMPSIRAVALRPLARPAEYCMAFRQLHTYRGDPMPA